MFISVRNRDLRRQMFPTSCWITAAHFVLQYADRMRQNIFTYCNQIIYLRPLNEMNLFD